MGAAPKSIRTVTADGLMRKDSSVSYDKSLGQESVFDLFKDKLKQLNGVEEVYSPRKIHGAERSRQHSKFSRWNDIESKSNNNSLIISESKNDGGRF